MVFNLNHSSYQNFYPSYNVIEMNQEERFIEFKSLDGVDAFDPPEFENEQMIEAYRERRRGIEEHRVKENYVNLSSSGSHQ